MNDAEVRLKVDIDGDKATSSLQNIGKVGAKIGKAVAVGATVAGTALIGLVGKSVQMAGELEQQIGGSEAVFGEFATQVQDKSKTAFASAGLSANDYLATINKMGALMQGSGIEQEKAMNLSSEAMQRAADVASIMGVDVNFAMESIAGAAKGNFTMMDNLGVGMDETALASYALEKGIKKTYSTMSKGEKVELAMQMFLEKSAYATGNYTKENKTFAGSLATMKAAFTNFMSGAGKIDDFIDSIVSFGSILITKIVEMAPKIISGIIQLINQIVPMLPALINSILPTLINGIIMVIQGLMVALPQIVTTVLPALIDGFIQLLNMFIALLPSMLPQLLTALIEGGLMLVTALAEQLPTMLPQIIDALLQLIPLLIKNLPLFIEAGFKLMWGLAKGLVLSIPKVLSACWDIIKQIGKTLAELAVKAWDIGVDLVKGLWNGIKDKVEWLYSKIKGFVKGALDKIKSFFGISSPSKEFAIIGRYNIEGLEEGIKDEEKNLNRTILTTMGNGLDLANKMGLGGNINSKMGVGSYGGSMTIVMQQPDIIMDGNKVGRATIPYITKTVKLSGGNV